MTADLLLFVAKLTLVLAFGPALAALLRGNSAAARHFVWALTLGGGLLLALVTMTAPSVPVAIRDWREPATIQQKTMPSDASSLPGDRSAPSAAVAQESRFPWTPELRHVITGVWATGFVLVLSFFVAGSRAVSRIARAAVDVSDAEWLTLTEEARRDVGVTRPVRVALSGSVTAPFTYAWLRPVVLLPSDAASWPEDRRRAALLHELAHVVRNDYLIQLLAGLACALYWFHPFAWLALRRLRREGEQATDDRVLTRAMIAPDYAGHLLAIAIGNRQHGFVRPLAVRMACPSHLEQRLRALLDETRLRGNVSRRLAGTVIVALALLTVPLAVAQPQLLPRPIERMTAFTPVSGKAEWPQSAMKISPDGVIHIQGIGPKVDLDEVRHGAVIDIEQGRITIARAAGMLDLKTDGGKITVGRLAGSVKAVTGYGRIDVELLETGAPQTVDATTAFGHVVIRLPSSFSGAIDIETAYTESHEPVQIESAWALNHDPVTDWEARDGVSRRFVRARGRVGNGPDLVRVRTLDGNVTIERAQ